MVLLWKRIGSPITITDYKDKDVVLYGKDLYYFVINNLIDMDDIETVNKLKKNLKPEIILDFNKNPYGEMKIKINYRERLSQKRLSLEKNKDNNNIIFIYMDNLSRLHFYRQYKKKNF